MFTAHIRNVLPKISYIGFTGMSIEFVDRKTNNFLEIISIYYTSRSILQLRKRLD
ncbi:MAG: hypothetical protein ACXAC8_20170 [Candidatus Hodarchaeales archaeon]